MKNKRRISGVLIAVGAVITICVVVSIRRADAVIAIIRPAVIFTVNPGQTARIHVIPSPDYSWSSGRSQRMLLGFDVYRISETIPRSVGSAPDTGCVKYHMIERQTCEVTISPGEAASFDFAVPSDGVATQISPVFSFQGNDSNRGMNSNDFIPTIEMREGGRTTQLLLLPAIQRARDTGSVD
jgi:hypothetical protein